MRLQNKPIHEISSKSDSYTVKKLYSWDKDVNLIHSFYKCLYKCFVIEIHANSLSGNTG